MKGGVEDNKVENRRRKRQVIKFSLHTGKERLHMPTKVCGCAKAILIVG
jgi:hypothetical protein